MPELFPLLLTISPVFALIGIFIAARVRQALFTKRYQAALMHENWEVRLKTVAALRAMRVDRVPAGNMNVALLDLLVTACADQRQEVRSIDEHWFLIRPHRFWKPVRSMM